MSIVAKSLLLAAAMLHIMAGSAQAWERSPAPVEFANRAERPVAARAQFAPRTPVRPATAALEMPEMLYGYGHAPIAAAQPVLDLRGALPGGAARGLLAADDFEDPSSSETQGLALAIEEVPASQVASASEPVVQSDSAAPALTSEQPEGGFFVQVGAFADPANAERVRTALSDVGIVNMDVRQGASTTLHRVRLGQWASRAEAELARDLIVERGFAGAVVATAR